MASKLGSDGPKKGWTDSELAALDRVANEHGMAAYHAWGALTGYSKSFDAFEVKRRRVVASSPATVPALDFGRSEFPAPQMVPQAWPYIGFNLAFWDLETTFSTQPIVLYGASADQFGQVTQFRKGADITNDRDLVAAIREHLAKADIWFTWNGKLFDVPVLNGRLRFHGMDPLPPRMHVDLMYKATGSSMRIGRRSLQSVSEYFDVPNRKTPLSVRLWDKAMAGDAAAYEKIAEHGSADVLVLRDVFAILKSQIGNIQR